MALRIDDLQYEGLKIYQEESGYCFTSDSVLLANYVKFLPGAKVVEFCAGSGVISILLSKKQKPKIIYGFEIMEKPYALFEKSVKLNNLEGVVIPVNKGLEDATSLLGVGYADVVLCNPPYLKPDGGNQDKLNERVVATKEVLTNLESVVENAAKLLKHGGKFFMVHRVDRLVDIMVELRKNKLEPKKMSIIYPTKTAEPVVFLIEAIKCGKPALRVSRATYACELNKSAN